MLLEHSDPRIFTGLHVSWNGAAVSLRPCFPDDWPDALYGVPEAGSLKPWGSWGPPSEPRAVLLSLLSRVHLLSTDFDACQASFVDALTQCVSLAGFPLSFVRRHALAWGRRVLPPDQVPSLLTALDRISRRTSLGATLVPGSLRP